MIVFGMLMFFLKKIRGNLKLILIEYFKCWEDVFVLQNIYKYFFIEIEDIVMLCYVVNLYLKLEEINGEFVFNMLGIKFKKNLLLDWEKKLLIMEDKYVGYFVVLVELLRIFVYCYLIV